MRWDSGHKFDMCTVNSQVFLFSQLESQMVLKLDFMPIRVTHHAFAFSKLKNMSCNIEMCYQLMGQALD